MNPDTMPSWLVDYLEENTGFSKPGKFGYPYYTATQESDAVVDFYKFISKPENLAKIPEVAELIEACKPEGREVTSTILGEGFTVFSLNREKINEALALFKGGE